MEVKPVEKKNLISPQWLRNVKDRNYPFWRIDTLFSKNKYQNIYFVTNGGWHFSYLKSAKDIEKVSGSLTGEYLSNKKNISIPAVRRKVESTQGVSIGGASHNNLKNLEFIIINFMDFMKLFLFKY